MVKPGIFTAEMIHRVAAALATCRPRGLPVISTFDFFRDFCKFPFSYELLITVQYISRSKQAQGLHVERDGAHLVIGVQQKVPGDRQHLQQHVLRQHHGALGQQVQRNVEQSVHLRTQSQTPIKDTFFPMTLSVLSGQAQAA